MSMADSIVVSEITGTVWKIEVSIGESVKEDDVLMILESMKMEIPVLATAGGTINSIEVSEGTSVSEGQTLVLLEG